MKLRKAIFWLHLIAGLLAGVVILVMSSTGVCLAFQSQILSWAERGFRHAAPPALGSRRLDLDDLLAKACAKNPDAQPSGLTLRSKAGATVLVSFGREDVLYMNRYTGEVLGRGSKIRGLMQKIENWHRCLGARAEHRAAARAITGACNLVFLLLVVTGFFLWWPRNWNWTALRPAVWFVRGLHGKSRDWNWHNTIGFWCAPVLIILTLTGVAMSYQWANNLLYKLTGNEPPRSTSRPGGDRRRDGSVSSKTESGVRQPATLEMLVAKAEQQRPNWKTLNLRLSPIAGTPVTVVIEESNSQFSFYRSQLTLNAATGEIIKWEPFSSQNLGRKLRTWARFLHTGEAAGIAGQVVATLASAGSVFLVCTGLAMGWRRFFGKKSVLGAA